MTTLFPTLEPSVPSALERARNEVARQEKAIEDTQERVVLLDRELRMHQLLLRRALGEVARLEREALG